MTLEDPLERALRPKLDALGSAPRAELLRVLMLPDYERAGEIGAYWRSETKTFAELLIDCEESPHTRGVVIGMLRETSCDRRGATACPRGRSTVDGPSPGRTAGCWLGEARHERSLDGLRRSTGSAATVPARTTTFTVTMAPPFATER